MFFAERTYLHIMAWVCIETILNHLGLYPSMSISPLDIVQPVKVGYAQLAHLALVNSRFHCPPHLGCRKKSLLENTVTKNVRYSSDAYLPVIIPVVLWPVHDPTVKIVRFKILETFLERLSNPIFKACVDIVGHIVGIVGSEPWKLRLQPNVRPIEV